MADEAEIVTPDPEDKKTRAALPAGKPPVTDPEAPYGWMTDPKTGERRPKKRPGKQSKNQPPPPGRKTNAARSAPKGSTGTPKAPADYSQPVFELINGLWMLGAGVPTVENKVFGYDLKPLTIRVKAQAAILKDNAVPITKGVNLMAQNNDAVRRGVEKLTSDGDSPLWVLPAMFALLPFVAQSAAMWRAPVAGDVELLAKRTENEWEDFMGAAMREAQAEAQAAAQAAQNDSPGAA